ncbi:MAG: hydrogenase iron-sulfur subunit [Proteobacteria bacterium]|nr:hydrogenase iron-sulfur subunit [Pseudomonadota bacterium]
MNRNPIIIAFCCNWCAYAAADLAGIARLQYPGSIRIIRVMCSGMVHPEMVLRALNQGADGVIIGGCQLGDCHYIKGNEMALARSEIIADTLDDLGFAPEQFQLVWVSAAEPERLVRAFREMSEQLRAAPDGAEAETGP